MLHICLSDSGFDAQVHCCTTNQCNNKKITIFLIKISIKITTILNFFLQQHDNTYKKKNMSGFLNCNKIKFSLFRLIIFTAPFSLDCSNYEVLKIKNI